MRTAKEIQRDNGRWIQAAFLFALLLAAGLWGAEAEPPSAGALLSKAREHFRKGDRAAAIRLASEAIQAEPASPEAYFFRAQLYEGAWEHAKAVADYTKVIKLDVRAGSIHQRRGSEYFKMGKFEEAIADWDNFLARYPDQEPHHWQRGIAYYYAGEFEKGARQFEQHQTVNSNDVENAVWHFLCVARKSGVEEARKKLIPIEGDSRVPMKQIHELFSGKGSPEKVMEAAREGNPPAAVLDRQLFYAHLYLGLYHEALGEVEKAREHLYKADENYKAHDYMGAVAHVHAEIYRNKKK